MYIWAYSGTLRPITTLCVRMRECVCVCVCVRAFARACTHTYVYNRYIWVYLHNKCMELYYSITMLRPSRLCFLKSGKLVYGDYINRPTS